MPNACKPIPPFTQKDKDRFWSFAEKREDGIWNWTGRKARNGYGRFTLKKKEYAAHRVAWILNARELGTAEQIPEGLSILHKHDVTPDVFDINPSNLWAGTQSENMRDMVLKGRKNNRNKKRGSECHASKLFPNDILEIRKLVSSGVRVCTIARKFGVAWNSIDKIKRGLTWKHIA